jgi:hypothetical protein
MNARMLGHRHHLRLLGVEGGEFVAEAASRETGEKEGEWFVAAQRPCGALQIQYCRREVCLGRGAGAAHQS